MRLAPTSVTVMSPHIVDLFAGPGGLDVAARWLDVHVEGIEWDSEACRTRREAGLITHEADVRQFGPANFPQANVLAGGPPCQTFTVAGTGAGRSALDRVLKLVDAMANRRDVEKQVARFEDERTGLVLEPLRWALKALADGRPYEAIVLEQVPAVLPVWEAMGAVLRNAGYGVAVGILRSEEFGVPQTRRRAILIARFGMSARLPTPTHQPYRKGVPRGLGDMMSLPWNTMGDALKATRRYPFSVVSNYGTGGNPKARGIRRSDEPAFTVTGKVSRNRLLDANGVLIDRITSAEAGRLQTFPLDFPWRGRDVAQQIGNAIPPRLGVHILAAALGRADALEEEFFECAIERGWYGSSLSEPLISAR
ncbi:DNA cytosine methyltransferase [Rhodococcus ruber]|uniref:DNA cytosine methyltransferase n=1 Tax=Rhodococcus ruber TaxID=1830 RepID=UPI00265B696C|nr:DNA cytosine methyltransferase [Rhodococcus ruber]WKK12692.1 DNA cytosine methyltransferase [Rhodococcus ruber]